MPLWTRTYQQPWRLETQIGYNQEDKLLIWVQEEKLNMVQYKPSQVKAFLFVKEKEKLVLEKVVHLPTIILFDIWNLELKSLKINVRIKP